jgi:RNA polymerase sigma-70 factor (ECF subfamily)
MDLKNAMPVLQEQEGLFDELIAYSGIDFHICLGFSANFSDAEELYQKVYLKTWSDMDSLKNQKSAKQWLLKIARNISLNHIRKRLVDTHG